MSDNPYDQWAQPDNPYAQWAGGGAAAKPAVTQTPTDYGDTVGGTNENDPTESTPWMGAARSLYHIGEKGANYALKGVRALAGSIDEGQPVDDYLKGTGFGSDTDLANRQETDKALLNTTGGKVGNLATDVALTAPISMLGAPAEGGSLLLRTLAAMGRGAGEGAAQGALTGNDPTDIASGAALGGVLSGAAKGVGGLVKGNVAKSAEAQELEKAAEDAGHEMQLPLSVSAQNPIVRGAYNSAAWAIPGVGHQLGAQGDEAVQTIRDMAAERALPEGMDMPTAKNEMARLGKIQSEFDKRYADTVGSYKFNVPDDFRAQVVRNIEDAMPEVDDVTKNHVATLIDQNMQRYANSGDVISGRNLLNAKNASGELYSGLNPVEREALSHGTDTFTDVIHNDLMQGFKPENLGDLETYNRLGEKWPDFKAYSRAVRAAKVNGGDFSPAQLASAAKPGTSLYDLGVLGNKVLGSGADTGASHASLRALAHVGGIGYGALYHPVVAAGTIGAGNALATRVGQRALTGDTALQQSLASALRNQYVRAGMSAARRAAVGAGVD